MVLLSLEPPPLCLLVSLAALPPSLSLLDPMVPLSLDPPPMSAIATSLYEDAGENMPPHVLISRSLASIASPSLMTPFIANVFLGTGAWRSFGGCIDGDGVLSIDLLSLQGTSGRRVRSFLVTAHLLICSGWCI